MARSISLVIPGAVPSKSNSYRRGKQGGFYSDPAIAVYSGTVFLEMGRAKVRPLDGPVSVEVVLYPGNNRGDLAGCEKALLDALQAWRYQRIDGRRVKVKLPFGCYHDDKQVKRLLLEHGGVDKLNPRAEVTVQAMDDRP